MTRIRRGEFGQDEVDCLRGEFQHAALLARVLRCEATDCGHDLREVIDVHCVEQFCPEFHSFLFS